MLASLIERQERSKGEWGKSRFTKKNLREWKKTASINQKMRSHMQKNGKLNWSERDAPKKLELIKKKQVA